MISGQTFFFVGGSSCASSAMGTVFLADFFPVPPGLSLANGAPAASSESEDGGGGGRHSGWSDRRPS